MWVWTEQPDQSWKYQIYSLNDWVDSNSQINRDGFIMTQANAITDNGQTIVGTGYHESTGYEAFRLRITGEDFDGFFMGHEVEADGRTVDTGNFIGLIDIEYAPNLYSHELNRYIWHAEDIKTDGGAWFWVYK